MLHTCFKFSIRAKFPFSGGRDSDGLDKEEQQTSNPDPKWIWTLYQRKWYVARIPKNEEVPTSLKSKMSKIREPSMAVQFAVDDKYSIIPMKKI